MILTCPKCATRYFVEAGELGAGLRVVECAGCHARWETPAETVPLFVAPPPPSRASRPANLGRAVVIAAIVLTAAGVGAVALRGEIAREWPGAAGVFAAIGLPAAGHG